MGCESYFYILLITFSVALITYNIIISANAPLTQTFPGNPSSLSSSSPRVFSVDPIIKMPLERSKKRFFHTAVTASDSVYNTWQCRIMYYWFKKFQNMPNSDMGGFTRILHSGKDDKYMDEIPTFIAQPLPDGMDQVCLPSTMHYYGRSHYGINVDRLSLAPAYFDDAFEHSSVRLISESFMEFDVSLLGFEALGYNAYPSSFEDEAEPDASAIRRSRRRARIVEESDEEEEEVEKEGRGGEAEVERSEDKRDEGEGEEEESESSEDTDEEQTYVGQVSPRERARLERFMIKHGLGGKEIILVPLGAEYSFMDSPQEGIMAFRRQIRLGMRLPLRRLVKQVLNFWDVASCQMNDNFYEMMKVVEGMNIELKREGRPANNRLKHPRTYIDVLINESEDWVNKVFRKLGIVRKRRKKMDTLLRDVPVAAGPSRWRKEAAQQTHKGKGKAMAEESTVQLAKTTTRKRSHERWQKKMTRPKLGGSQPNRRKMLERLTADPQRERKSHGRRIDCAVGKDNYSKEES
ncbi:hypothetical protein GIB67_020135 [Kingdonia uniflora]|uniref:Hydroxyproline O-arabinosyltransferase-like domain-containing protein n=1 Tax=Kingdonia uniflora TaxID=39325 RepID=A0A7J7NIB0_9MAGN|nr:hypothetical protein GIB67_020135 [Kingdonia uniflora]